ncbi:hypothetical protein HYH03_011274 [Edaphochlamys debaryana]|uniref:Uncharacterized protein n=1 Tax=Edaphochlamys debaryana TaxID=47281 RepID=A0A835XU70_9CHLO|nr:hypothetical protein HYH03_011270 [Edaphochlamys debaryana]KAG2490320.1 hypothetical protein HYH03_011271 [Edaphochlamys debaryana]KAG2490322.1 hypothetical protein HYH03_011273 [Edaphochlamys debaryana]KAG2490323.1 hypothetical protein HYH03_011274 [Edaphochlamys debaryana]|eukprot:KAG2490319.1 hypothetical protein HYH03_011270 [Edaphochlamys debaryana]
MSNKIIYAGLVVSQLLTFAAYVVVSAGAALLQKKANTLTLFNGLEGQDLKDMRDGYSEVFQSTTYIIPYPQQPKYQFQYQWWIIEFELFVFLLTATCTIFPSIIRRLRPVALTFIASAFVLVMDNINAIFFLLRNDTAKAVYDDYRIATAQAGLIMVGVANGLTIFFLGMYDTEEDRHQQEVPSVTAKTTV